MNYGVMSPLNGAVGVTAEIVRVATGVDVPPLSTR